MNTVTPAPSFVFLAVIGGIFALVFGVAFWGDWTPVVGHALHAVGRALRPITRVQGLKLPSPTDPRWTSTMTLDALESARRLGATLPAEYTLGPVKVRADSDRLKPRLETVELLVGAVALDISRDDVLAYVLAVHTYQTQKSIRAYIRRLKTLWVAL